MPATILTGSALAEGIRSNFDLAYQGVTAGVEKELGMVMGRTGSDGRQETYGMHESMPGPALRRIGDPIAEEGTGTKSFSVVNYEFARRVPWYRRDRTDNRIANLFVKATDVGRKFGMLDSRVFIGYMTGNAVLVPTVPNAPDGLALYAANRFGVSGGNIITGTGVATAAAIEADFWNAVELFGEFQDTKGDPYYEADVESPTYVVYFKMGNWKVWADALKATALHSVVSSTGAAIPTTVNVGNFKIRMVPTQRITDNDSFIFRSDAPVPAIFAQDRQPLRSVVATEDNSDVARTDGKEYVDFHLERGYGINVPYQTVKINN